MVYLGQQCSRAVLRVTNPHSDLLAEGVGELSTLLPLHPLCQAGDLKRGTHNLMDSNISLVQVLSEVLLSFNYNKVRSTV